MSSLSKTREEKQWLSRGGKRQRECAGVLKRGQRKKDSTAKRPWRHKEYFCCIAREEYTLTTTEN